MANERRWGWKWGAGAPCSWGGIADEPARGGSRPTSIRALSPARARGLANRAGAGFPMGHSIWHPGDRPPQWQRVIDRPIGGSYKAMRKQTTPVVSKEERGLGYQLPWFWSHYPIRLMAAIHVAMCRMTCTLYTVKFGLLGHLLK